MAAHNKAHEAVEHVANNLLEIKPAQMHCAECPVRELALFRVVPADYIRDAESHRTGQYRLQARKHLYEEGAEALKAFTLFEGWILLYRSHSDGGRQGMRVALPGDFLGYAPPGMNQLNHSALAITDSVLCGFAQEDLHNMLHAHPDLAERIAAIQSRDMARCQAAMLGLGRKSAEQRIAYLLMELYARMELRERVNSVDQSMAFPLTQEMLGDLTGLTPVHTNRVLRKLRNDGVLTIERHRLQIHDRDRLIEIGEFNGIEEERYV